MRLVLSFKKGHPVKCHKFFVVSNINRYFDLGCLWIDDCYVTFEEIRIVSFDRLQTAVIIKPQTANIVCAKEETTFRKVKIFCFKSIKIHSLSMKLVLTL